jgi:hypothetical protein
MSTVWSGDGMTPTSQRRGGGTPKQSLKLLVVSLAAATLRCSHLTYFARGALPTPSRQC